LFAVYNGKNVIHNISFQAQRGESLCVLGPNGSGKSTLLKALSRIINYKGTVSINGSDISNIPRKELAKKIAILSQNSQVYFPYTVWETVSMGRYAYSQGFLKNQSTEDKKIIKDILHKLDIYSLKDCLIDELSGGNLQRVFLARTLTQTPDLILLDEPANHLDLKHQLELLDFLKTWVKQDNKILISVFHDINMARQFGDSVIIMNSGNISADGRIDQILDSQAINSIYGIDIREFMQKSFNFWL